MRKSTLSWVFGFLILLYVILSIGLPPDQAVINRLNLSETHARVLTASIVLPLAVIYIIAYYGAFRLTQYAAAIKSTNEGNSYKQLAKGLMVHAFSLPLTAMVISLLTTWAADNSDMIPTLGIVRNYIRLAFALVAFTLIARGAEGLIKTLENRRSTDRFLVTIFATVAVSCLFTWLIISRPISGDMSANVYFLPNWLVVTTLAIPYLFIWCRGMRAMYHLYKYRTNVKGKVYRSALGDVAKGIGAIILIAILTQLLLTISARLLNRLNVTPLLLILYALVALYAVGYILVARGANKLKRIEEV